MTVNENCRLCGQGANFDEHLVYYAIQLLAKEAGTYPKLECTEDHIIKYITDNNLELLTDVQLHYLMFELNAIT